MEQYKGEKHRIYRNALAEKLHKTADLQTQRTILEKARTENEYKESSMFHRRSSDVFRLLREKGLFPPEMIDVASGFLQKRGKEIAKLADYSLIQLVDQSVNEKTHQDKPSDIIYYTKNIQKNNTRLVNRVEHILQGDIELPKKMKAHQLAGLRYVKDFLEKGYTRGIIVHPTGSGKTVLFATLIAGLNERTLVVVPKKNLVAQTYRELCHYFDEQEVTHVSSTNIAEDTFVKSHEGKIVITTYNSLISKQNQLASQAFSVMILDEVHNTYTDNIQKALRLFPHAIKIGFTATPDYLYTAYKKDSERIKTDEEVILYRDPARSARRYYPHEIHRIGLKEAISQEILAPCAAAQVEVAIDFDDIGIEHTPFGLDFNQAQLGKKLDDHWTLIEKVVRDLFTNPENQGLQSLKDKQMIIGTLKIAHTEQIAALLSSIGIPAASISGRTSDKDRDTLIQSFKKGQIKALASAQVLKEGFDAPNATVLLNLRPTASRLFYEQLLGRVLRKDPHNEAKVALVIDVMGIHTKQNVFSAPLLFGVKEFYNGAIIAPPDYSIRNAQNANNNGYSTDAYDDYSVRSQLKIIELIDSKTEEEIAKGVIIVDDALYMTRKTLVEHLKLRNDSIFIDHLFDRENSIKDKLLETYHVSVERVNGKIYYHAGQSLDSFWDLILKKTNEYNKNQPLNFFSYSRPRVSPIECLQSCTLSTYYKGIICALEGKENNEGGLLDSFKKIYTLKMRALTYNFIKNRITLDDMENICGGSIDEYMYILIEVFEKEKIQRALSERLKSYDFSRLVNLKFFIRETLRDEGKEQWIDALLKEKITNENLFSLFQNNRGLTSLKIKTKNLFYSVLANAPSKIKHEFFEMCRTQEVPNLEGKTWFDLIDMQEKIQYCMDYSERIDAQLLQSDYELKKTLFASTANRRKIKKQLQTKHNENAQKILISINDYEHNLARQQFEREKTNYQNLLTRAEQLVETKALYKSAFKTIRDPSGEKIQWQQILYDERLRAEVIYIAYPSKTEMASDGTKIKHSFPLPTNIKNTYYFKRSKKPIGERKGVLIYGAYITHPLPEDFPQFKTILLEHTG